jgi:hypothetical protein
MQRVREKRSRVNRIAVVLVRNYGQNDVRSPLGIVIDGLFRRNEFGLLCEGSKYVQASVELREVAAR